MKYIYLLVFVLLIAGVSAESQLYALNGYNIEEWNSYGDYVDYTAEGKLYLENNEILNLKGNTWVDYTEEFDFLVESGKFNFGFYQSGDSRYYVQFRETVLELYRENNDGTVNLLASYIGAYVYNDEYHMKIYVSDSLIDVYLEDVNIFHYQDTNPLMQGSIGFESIDGAGYISNLNVVGTNYCNNGFSDYDELGVDCGGSCNACLDETPIDQGVGDVSEDADSIPDSDEEDVLTDELDSMTDSLDDLNNIDFFEVCDDMIDNDRDTFIDCADSDCVLDSVCGGQLPIESECGNRICEAGEDSYTCPKDCKAKRGLRIWFMFLIIVAIIAIVLIVLLRPKPKVIVINKKRRKK